MNEQEDREMTEEESQLAELRKLALTKTIELLAGTASGRVEVVEATASFNLFERLCAKCYERGIK